MHIVYFINFILHLNAHLGFLTAQYGAWVYAALFAVIFCETGLVVTAILPGDSLLFAAGAVAARGMLDLKLLLFLLIIAAFLGNVVNYWIGRKFGHWLLARPRFFKQSHFDRTHAFYEKYGGKTIVIARFMPIIRTFAPFVAGMGKMLHSRFIWYNFLGALFWVALLLLCSYWFGNFPFVQKNFSYVILAIIIISVLPIGWEFFKRIYPQKV